MKLKATKVFLMSGPIAPIIFLSAEAVQAWFEKNKPAWDGETLLGGGMGPNMIRRSKDGPLQYPIHVENIAAEIKKPGFLGLYFGYKPKGTEKFLPVEISTNPAFHHE